MRMMDLLLSKECSSKKRMAEKRVTCKDLIMTKDKFDSISLKKYAEDSYLIMQCM